MRFRCPQSLKKHRNSAVAVVLVFVALASTDASAQKRSKKKVTPTPANTDIAKLRDEYAKASNDYKASLEKLLVIYESNVSRAEEKLVVAKQLFAEGLVAKVQVDENEAAVKAAQDKVSVARHQMDEADKQVAAMLVE